MRGADDYIPNTLLVDSLAGHATELLAQTGIEADNALIICDQHTYPVMGKQLARETGSRYLMLPGRPYADDRMVAFIRSHDYHALIAVGSGTINDLCKYASFLDHKDYVVFPTAPSMNGYLSANASISKGRHKQSLAAHLPRGVFCDLGVLASAPLRLIQSGLGDSLCRPTAQADWLLSHLLLETPYTSLPFSLLEPYEKELFNHADKLLSGDLHVIALLMNTLLASGRGMVVAGGSYPASQGEHLIAHTMEMKYGSSGAFHGEEIAVTTLIMAEIQETFLASPLTFSLVPDVKAEIEHYFPLEMAESIYAESQAKFQLCHEQYAAISEKIASEEVRIRDRIREVTLPSRDLCRILEKADVGVKAESVGWDQERLALATRNACLIRNRFTFLDLLQLGMA